MYVIDIENKGGFSYEKKEKTIFGICVSVSYIF